MKFIDIENWNRKDHYNYFKKLNYPRFNICANLDITKFYSYIKENEIPFFISMLFASTKTANNIKEFRFRIIESVTNTTKCLREPSPHCPKDIVKPRKQAIYKWSVGTS